MLDDYASAGTTMDNIDTISLYEGEKTEHKVYKKTPKRDIMLKHADWETRGLAHLQHRY